MKFYIKQMIILITYDWNIVAKQKRDMQLQKEKDKEKEK